MNDVLKQETLKVMAQHKICVIATVDGHNKPESAIVGFSYSDNLGLLIGTSNTTRKYTNLQQNPHVAITIGDFHAEVQYEGTARQLAKNELGEHLQTSFKQLPGTAKYQEDPTQVWLLVTPTWLRLTVHETPLRVEEVILS